MWNTFAQWLMLSFDPDPQFPGHGPDWDIQLMWTVWKWPQGCHCHKLTGGGLHIVKIARLHLFSKSFSFFENKLKCLLLHEAFSDVLYFLSTCSLDSCSDRSHSAQYLDVPDHDIPEKREHSSKSMAFEQPQKQVPSPMNPWTSYLTEPHSSSLNRDEDASL